jgi:hypothetical protein
MPSWRENLLRIDVCQIARSYNEPPDDCAVATTSWSEKMQNTEYSDLTKALYECRDLIREAHSRGLPTMVSGKENAEKIEKLFALNVLDRASAASIQLCERFRSVLDEVEMEVGGPIDQFSYEDIKRLADRYSEWC